MKKTLKKGRKFLVTGILALSLITGGLSGCSTEAKNNTTEGASSKNQASSDSKVASQTSGAEETSLGEKDKDRTEKIIIWYEGNDSRLPYFKAVEAEMQKDYPNISIEAVTFDNATLMTKALQAVTTTGGVDLIFNSASRLLEAYQQSGEGFESLDTVLQTAQNKEVATEGDVKLSSSHGNLVVFPINRSLAGLGIKTDVEGVEVKEDTVALTWEEFLKLGQAFKSAGKSGFTMHLGTDPGQVFNLFMAGSGMQDVWLNGIPESQIETNKASFLQIMDLYNGENAFWDKDATTEDFAAMYTKIQSGSVGMFRVGDWNVAKWDLADSGVGSFKVLPWPAMDESHKPGLVNTNTRGMALPKNAPNKEAAKIFLQYALSKPAQTVSFETMGSALDSSVIDMEALSPNQKIFFDPAMTIYSIDTYFSQFSYYPELLEIYEKGITNALNSQNKPEVETKLDQLNQNLKDGIKANT